MTTPITADRDEGAAVTHLSVKSDRCYKGLHYIEGAPFRISFWTIATNIEPTEGVRRLRFADDLAAAWNTRQQAEAAYKAREDALVEALRFMVDGRAGAREHAKATLALLARAHTATDAGGE